MSAARGLPGRPLSEHGAHRNAEIESDDVDQIALMDVLATAQLRAAHAAAIKNMGEAALDHFAARAHGLLADARFQSASVAIDRRARLVVAMPTQVNLGGLRLGDAGFPGPAVEPL